MSWVPIVGSAFGNVLGGFVSDFFIGRQSKVSCRATALSADAAVSPIVISSLSQFTPLVDDGAEASSVTKSEGGTGAGAGEPSDTGTPLLGSAGENEVVVVDQSLRMWVAGWSNLLPVPLIVGAFLLEFPYCFLIMIFSGMVSSLLHFSFKFVVCIFYLQSSPYITQLGEMYMGQALATITDHSLTPSHHVTPAVALFMFIITIIGGNMPLIVPLVASWTGFDGEVDMHFSAAPAYIGAGTGKWYGIDTFLYVFFLSFNRFY
jgi:hypothetical protein